MRNPFLKPLLSTEESALLQTKIKEAEAGSAGEIKIVIEHKSKADPLERAGLLFEEIGLAETAADTGVLLYVAVKSRNAAVYAGEGLFKNAESDVWEQVLDAVADGFTHDRPFEGLVSALELIGETLRAQAPSEDLGGDEVPNEVIEQ